MSNSWKDPNNEFRTSPEFELKEIPTIVEYGTVSKFESHEFMQKKKEQSKYAKIIENWFMLSVYNYAMDARGRFGVTWDVAKSNSSFLSVLGNFKASLPNPCVRVQASHLLTKSLIRQDMSKQNERSVCP